MCKFSLRVTPDKLQEKQMSDAAYVVEQAAGWAKAIVTRESRGPGDTENAMRRIEARYGVPFTALWSLRYRPPKAVLAHIWLRLQAAYIAECERQMRLLAHETEIARTIAGAAHAAVRQSEALVVHKAESPGLSPDVSEAGQ